MGEADADSARGTLTRRRDSRSGATHLPVFSLPNAEIQLRAMHRQLQYVVGARFTRSGQKIKDIEDHDVFARPRWVLTGLRFHPAGGREEVRPRHPFAAIRVESRGT